LPDIEFPEVFDVDRIGESSLDDAMPWDMIQPAVYAHSDDIQPLLGALQSRHDIRVADDPDFNYVRALSLRNKENSKRTHVSLNEATRVAEKTRDDQWRLDLENALRLAKGDAPLANLEELEDEFDAAARDEEEPDPKDDAMLVEAGYILRDYIGLVRQVAMVENFDQAVQ
jgi:carboxyl-terminal processing protease